MDPSQVAAIIPAFDAEATVGDVVKRTLPHVARVVVVDDGSSDRTAEVARQSGAHEVLQHPTNHGKGRALRTAFEVLLQGNFTAVVTLDADGQHVPEEIGALLEAADTGADLVLGSREHLFAEMSSLRRASNSVSSRVISAFAGQRLHDVQTGFRLYRRALIEASLLREDRFDAESAVVVRAIRHGFQVVLTPVRMDRVDGRSTSHYRPVVDSLRIARAVIRARMEVPV